MSGGQTRSGDSQQLSTGLNALSIAPSYDVRQGINFIDEEGALEIPVNSGSDDDKNDEEDEEELTDEEEPESSGHDSQLEAAAWDESLNRVDDEDWEIAEGGEFSFF